jgi:hypothetical protein
MAGCRLSRETQKSRVPAMIGRTYQSADCFACKRLVRGPSSDQKGGLFKNGGFPIDQVVGRLAFLSGTTTSWAALLPPGRSSSSELPPASGQRRIIAAERSGSK